MFSRRKPESEAETNPAARAVLPVPGAVTPVSPAAQPEPAQPDNGLGVPPFRPAAPPDAILPSTLSKETMMARSPFAPAQTPATAPMGGVRPAPSRDGGERRTLVVGRGISVQGVVQDAERLVVEGTVEATMINAVELSIAHGGVFKGEVEVEEAEVAGTIDGTLTARHALIVRGTGRVLGTARCRRLQVEDGGQITGRIEMIADLPTSSVE
ncbi:MAG TPA: polymer-forming cytoskeletal protein [Acetobacteraceae bacterium]|nr:polymer-forming cytoskeletal protein [Acetobacteraceae bacterium]